MIQAVAFDLDDTLYPESTFVHSGYRAVAEFVSRDLGVEIAEIYDALAARFASGQRMDPFTPVLAAALGSVEEAYVQRLVEIYRSHRPTLAAYPETTRVLDRLRPSFSLGLITDGLADVQERKFKALAFHEYFGSTVYTGIWGREFWKPHPRGYETCAAALGATLEAMVYVGDNPLKDFVTARRLGMFTIRVRRPGTLHAALEAEPGFEADREAADLEEAADLIMSLAEEGKNR